MSDLVGLVRALAHDCESTDGWEDGAPTLHAAADRILILETRIAAVLEWADCRARTERREDDEQWGRGWETGYDAAASMVTIMLNRPAEQSALNMGGESK